MKKIISGIMLVLVILIAGCQNDSESVTENAVQSKITEIKIDAFKFGYDPEIVEVKKGETVKISVNNRDVPHGIRIPQLNLKGENELEFKAEQRGEYEWYCLVPCGSGHKTMRGKIIVY